MLTVYITRDISCVQYIYLISVSNFKHKDLYQVRYLYLTPGQGREDLAVHQVRPSHQVLKVQGPCQNDFWYTV